MAPPARVAALFVLPYLLLGLAWAVTNPPGAAPDESDHLVKALGAGRLNIGEEYRGPPLFDGAVGRRNASISRTVPIPARLAPDGYSCTAFQPAVSAGCQPDRRPAGYGTVERITSVGSYPIFAYVPLGVAALGANTPAGAFLAARLASLFLSGAFLFLGAWHLNRWLGRWSLLGLVVGLTPMTVFSAASVSTSGLEIMSATALACVAVVATRKPESLSDTATIGLIGLAGSALILSRQLGIVTLVLLSGFVLARGGARPIWSELRRGRRPMLLSGAAIAISCVALLAWERAFDHPVETGSVVSRGAVSAFVDQLYRYVATGVGVFGWLDTPLPGVAIGAWVVLAVLICGLTIVGGHRADRWSLGMLLGAVTTVAYVTHATVFYSVGAGLQGRHILPAFAVVPILAGVVVVELLSTLKRPDVVRRLFVAAAVGMGGMQLLAVLVNARRYAVGTTGPVLFLADAEWSPHLGWLAWILTASVASVWLVVLTIRSWPSTDTDLELLGATNVER